MTQDYSVNSNMYYVEINNAIVPSVYYGDRGCCNPPAYGGVFDSHKNIVAESLNVRNWGGKTVDVIKEGKNNLESRSYTRLNGTYIFGGYIFLHYGHFIMESTARLWVSREMPDIPIFFIGLAPKSPMAELSAWSSEVLDILRINKDRTVLSYSNNIKTILSIEKLIVPTPGIVLDTVASAEYLQIMGDLSSVPDQHKDIDKLWLSRISAKNQKIANTEEIENTLKNNGWKICQLEKMPTVKDQLDIISRAKNISGFEGSAYHNLVLISNNILSNTNIKIFNRGRKIPIIFDIINKNKGLDKAIIYDTNIKDGVVLDPKQIYDILL